MSRSVEGVALRQRAQILLASDSEVAAAQIAQVFQTDENQVRRVIAEFNTDGWTRSPSYRGRASEEDR